MRERLLGLAIAVVCGWVTTKLALDGWAGTGGALRSALEAEVWSEATCTVTAHTVVSRPTRKGEVHGAEATYTWAWEGVDHVGHRVTFAPPTSSGSRSVAEAQRDRYPAGAVVPCFVDPRHPTEAVLDRSAWSALTLWGPIALAMAVGFGVSALVGLTQALEPPASWLRDPEHRPGTPLRQRESKGSLLVVAAIGSGASLAGLVYFGRAPSSELQVWLAGGFGSLLLGSLPLAGYALLQALAPRLTLMQSPDPPAPGRPFELGWSFSRRRLVAGLSLQLVEEQRLGGALLHTRSGAVSLVEALGEDAVAGVVTATIPCEDDTPDVRWCVEARVATRLGPTVVLTFEVPVDRAERRTDGGGGTG